jgi:chromosome segregation ATPase
MDAIEKIIEQEQSVSRREVSTVIENLRTEIDAFSDQLDRLAKMEQFLQQKHIKKIEKLVTSLSALELERQELKSLSKELGKNRDMRAIIHSKIRALEHNKEHIQLMVKDVRKYSKSCDEQVKYINTERESLNLRVEDLKQLIDIAESTELTDKELNMICQRINARKKLLAEIQSNLRKRTIDLLFEGSSPPINNIHINNH